MSIQLFDISGARVRFGTTEDGTPYAVASDFAKTMGYRDASDATRLLDSEEVGTQIVRVNLADGRVQNREMKVIFEDGLWELIFRSSLPGAKAIKARVKAILRQIRETGRYEVARPEPSKLELARDLVAALESREAAVQRAAEAEQQVRVLEPSANAWDVLAEASGDYSLREAAHILNRDPSISTGQNRLLSSMRDLGMVDRRGVPYAKHAGHLRERPTSYTHPHTGESTLGRPQIRVTVQGLRYLHRKLGGVAPLRFDQPRLPEAG
ncbi:phage antirepressor KilAC domain-containing protein [Streptomyces sp. NPDC004838]